MFEQAVLETSNGGRRAMATGAGFAGQAALALCIVIAPIIWPQALPKPQWMMSITPPPPPPAAPEHMTAVKPRSAQNAAPLLPREIVLPTRIPPRVAQVIEDPGVEAPVGLGVTGGLGVANASDLLGRLLREAESQPKPAVRQPESKPQPEEVKLIRVSSLDPGRLIHRVEPIYPAIAKTAHVSGTVELSAIIGTDGHIRELRVLSGHPLLRKAATDAVSQWIYKPTVLNGANVEIAAPISVIFRLN